MGDLTATLSTNLQVTSVHISTFDSIETRTRMRIKNPDEKGKRSVIN